MRYKWTLLRASQFLLDGGGMFGIIPRVVWERAVTPDDKHRVRLMHNCLLLESVEADPATGKPRRYVIEAGTGDKLDEKMSTIFGLDGRTIESEVVRAGVEVGDIDATIVTHLHFDHAGGLTRRAREGEEADWVANKPGAASGDCNDIKFTFPNAELITQRREWVDARNNDAVMTRTYYRDHLLPFEDERLPLEDGRPRLRLIDSPRPFPLNRKPSREELPKNPLDERLTEVLPGISVFLIPGHTWGQQAIRFEDEAGRTIVFTSDLLPTHYHIGQPYSLGYDVEPYTSMVTKHWFLREAAERDWVLVLDHDPGNPCFRVRANDRGWFDLVEEDCGIAPA
ncbi:MAG: MBL fold metallo-hydrolase [Phycisphaerales bacterium]|nr:MBL fold metallo-hydrolase [Phycisphaerales bacterium]